MAKRADGLSQQVAADAVGIAVRSAQRQILPILADQGQLQRGGRLGYRRSQGGCLGLGLQVQTSYGVGSFAISPPEPKGYGSISTW